MVQTLTLIYFVYYSVQALFLAKDEEDSAQFTLHQLLQEGWTVSDRSWDNF